MSGQAGLDGQFGVIFADQECEWWRGYNPAIINMKFLYIYLPVEILIYLLKSGKDSMVDRATVTTRRLKKVTGSLCEKEQESLKIEATLFFSQTEKERKKEKTLTPPCPSTFSQLPGLVYSVAGRARVLRKEQPTDRKEKKNVACRMTTWHRLPTCLSRLAKDVFFFFFFMACDPSKRFGACHDAALDDRDRLEIMRMAKVNIVL